VKSVPTGLLICVCAAALASYGQEAPKPVPAPKPATPPAPAQAQTPAKQADSSEEEDQGFGIGVFYWYDPGHLKLRNGHGAVVGDNPANLDFPGKNKPTPGAELSLPAGKHNSVHLTYFRVQGSGSSIAPANLKIYGQDFSKGDTISTKYTMQNFKVSLDYLSWPYPPKSAGALRLKTLWQVQYLAVKPTISSPSRDAANAASSSLVTKTHTIVFPTLGVGLEKRFSKSFRWEVQASGFGLPKRSALGDGETFFAVRVGTVEAKFGGKVYYFKTSPKKAEYVHDLLPGAFVELSWHPRLAW
jgi:hypothetical protein